MVQAFDIELARLDDLERLERDERPGARDAGDDAIVGIRLHDGPREILKCSADLHVDFRNRVGGQTLYGGPEPVVLLAELPRASGEEERACWIAEECVEHFRQIVNDLAVVGHLAADARASLQQQAIL